MYLLTQAGELYIECLRFQIHKMTFVLTPVFPCACSILFLIKNINKIETPLMSPHIIGSTPSVSEKPIPSAIKNRRS